MPQVLPPIPTNNKSSFIICDFKCKLTEFSVIFGDSSTLNNVSGSWLLGRYFKLGHINYSKENKFFISFSFTSHIGLIPWLPWEMVTMSPRQNI